MKIRRNIPLTGFLVLAFLLAGVLSACSTSSSSSGPLDGQGLMEQRCSVCHSLTRVKTAHKTADEWKTTVDRMIGHGAQLTATEEQTLIDYLAANYK